MKIYDPFALGLSIKNKSGNGKEFRCTCPYCNHSSADASYNIEKQILYCFRCKAKSKAKQLANDLSGELVFVDSDSIFIVDEYEGLDDSWKNLILRNKTAKNNAYLSGRMVTDEQISRFAIKENSEGVVFPLLNKFDDLIGAQMRNYTKNPKYLFYGVKPQIWPYSSLYTPGPLIVTEGIFGALRADLAGYRAVANFGTGSVYKNVKLFRANPHLKPVIWFDPDYAGWLACGKYCLNGFPVILGKGNIDEMHPEKLKVRFNGKRTFDVMDIIRYANDDRLQPALEEYWDEITTWKQPK